MLHNPEQRTDETWARTAVTAFADDFISTFILNSLQDAATMPTRIKHHFAVLTEADM